MKREHGLFFISAILISVIFLAGGCGKDKDPETVKDADGNTYKTIRIGEQLWMAENLRVKHYSDNSAITGVRAYGDKDENAALYGRLYSFAAATGSGVVESGFIRGACPKGWHLPSDAEWKELEAFLGMPQDDLGKTSWRGTTEGGMLKETGTSHWAEPNTDASNSVGFTAMPGGTHNAVTGYTSLGLAGYYWCSTPKDEHEAWSRALHHSNAQIGRYASGKDLGASIRCIMD